jgi:hypothetical protein
MVLKYFQYFNVPRQHVRKISATESVCSCRTAPACRHRIPPSHSPYKSQGTQDGKDVINESISPGSSELHKGLVEISSVYVENCN